MREVSFHPIDEIDIATVMEISARGTLRSDTCVNAGCLGFSGSSDNLPAILLGLSIGSPDAFLESSWSVPQNLLGSVPGSSWGFQGGPVGFS